MPSRPLRQREKHQVATTATSRRLSTLAAQEDTSALVALRSRITELEKTNQLLDREKKSIQTEKDELARRNAAEKDELWRHNAELLNKLAALV